MQMHPQWRVAGGAQLRAAEDRVRDVVLSQGLVQALEGLVHPVVDLLVCPGEYGISQSLRLGLSLVRVRQDAVEVIACFGDANAA